MEHDDQGVDAAHFDDDSDNREQCFEGAQGSPWPILFDSRDAVTIAGYESGSLEAAERQNPSRMALISDLSTDDPKLVEKRSIPRLRTDLNRGLKFLEEQIAAAQTRANAWKLAGNQQASRAEETKLRA